MSATFFIRRREAAAREKMLQNLAPKKPEAKETEPEAAEAKPRKTTKKK